MLQYHYLKALCNKQMKNYKAAEEDYEPVLKEVRRQEGMKMFRIIFGIFIFPKDTFKSILNEQAYVFKEVTSLFEKARTPYFT